MPPKQTHTTRTVTVRQMEQAFNDVDLASPLGRCRRCGCGEVTPCPGGCAWADAEQTVCTACVDKRFRIAASTRGGSVSLVDNRTGYRRRFLTAREAARAAVQLT